MPFQVEHTDTYGGEANYSWVRRKVIYPKEGASTRSIVRMAKAAIGMSGVRSGTLDHGDLIELHYPKRCLITFITWVDAEHAPEPPA